MSDHTALWVLLILLLVLLVLVVVTARRGPWQKPPPNPDAPIVVRVPVDMLGQIELVRFTDVDPLWGRNPPESWS